MTSRKTIMVESPVWDKTDRFKHRICVRSIGEAITEAIDIATSREFYAGVHQFEDGTFRVESVGRTEGEAIRNLIRLYEYFEEDALHERDVYVHYEAPEKKECFYTCLCTFDIYVGMKLYAHIDEWETDDDCIYIPFMFDKVADTKEEILAPLALCVERFCVLVNTKTNAVVGYGDSVIKAFCDIYENGNGGYSYEDLIACDADPDLYAEALNFGCHLGLSIYCKPETEKWHNYIVHYAVNDSGYWAVIELLDEGIGLVHGVGITGNEAIHNSLCLKKNSAYDSIYSWDATNFDEWIHVPITDYDDTKGRSLPGILLEPQSNNPFIVIRCTKELYRQAIASDEIKEGIKCRISGNKGNRSADVWRAE